MNPAAMLLARFRGTWNFNPATDALLMHYPDYLLVGVAVVISHVVTSLGQQVAKAREMGSYQLGELLGRGGMGEVYKATHRMLARPAAIKLIRPEMIAAGDPAGAHGAVMRFRREAEAAANLRSPHTVELYDFGVTDDQTLYFVMELLEGMDLESLVQRHGPVPAGRVVHILRQRVQSLEEAHVARPGPSGHQAGEHPSGAARARLRLRQGPRLRPREADRRRNTRAIAEHAGRAAPGDARLHGARDGAGRQRGRTSGPLRPRVRRLLPADRHSRSSTAPRRWRSCPSICRPSPMPPSKRGPFSIPPDLDQLVLACLAKRPEDRPQSAAELARRLAAIDLEPWTDAQAKAWWLAQAPQPADVRAAEVTRLSRAASGADETRPR